MGLNAEDKVESLVQRCWPCELTLCFFPFFVYLWISRILFYYSLTNLAINIQYHISFNNLQVNDKFNITFPSEYEYAFLESLWCPLLHM